MNYEKHGRIQEAKEQLMQLETLAADDTKEYDQRIKSMLVKVIIPLLLKVLE